MKRSVTLPTFGAGGAMGIRSQSTGLLRIQSFSELTAGLSQGVALTAANKLRRVKAVAVSSAVSNPSNPVMIYEIADESKFNAVDVAQLLIKHKMQGIPVYDLSKKKFAGAVELLDFARILSQDTRITTAKPSFKRWLGFLSVDGANEELRAQASKRRVWHLPETANLLDVVDLMAEESIRRVVLTDPITGKGVAVISETDVLEYFSRHRSMFTFKDGSEIPIHAGDVVEDPEASGMILKINRTDSFLIALNKLLDADMYSVPVVDENDKLVNTLTASDLKSFFCAPKGCRWDMNIVGFLDTCCSKSKYVDHIVSCTLGVPLTRIIEAMKVDKAHVIWVTDTHGVCIGEVSITDVCSYLMREETVSVKRHPDEDLMLPSVSETKEDEFTSDRTPKPGMQRTASGLFTPKPAADSRGMPGTPQMHRRHSIGSDGAGTPLSIDSDGIPKSPFDAAIPGAEPRDGIIPEDDVFEPPMAMADRSAYDLLKTTQKKIERKFEFGTRRMDWVKKTGVKNEVTMITYPDCFGGTLAGLSKVLNSHLEGVVSGVHILPFYPSSADRGFAPLTYKEVDAEFGDWADVVDMTKTHDVACDFMVNHISQMSAEFQDFKKRRFESPFADMFIRFEEFWARSGGHPTAKDLDLIYTRKPRAPYFEFPFGDDLEPATGKVWCTFDFQQIDLNVRSEAGRKFIRSQLESICKRGVKIIRLDAFGYATKKLDTRCFMEEPEVWEVMDWLYSIVEPFGVELLAEIHEHYSIQLALSRQSGSKFWVYDFCLPMLLLQSLYDANCANLHHWLCICPQNQFTTLDTHDGIGVVDVKDLMTEEETARTSENLYKYGASLKRIYSSSNYDNLDIYQINCSYYSALGNNDMWYMCARAVQLFAPGVPQIYYVGLLAGKNDIALVEKTRVGRDINRHNYTLEELETEVKRPVVQQLFSLCRFRNTYPAFNGVFVLDDLQVSEFGLCGENLRCGWELADEGLSCFLEVDFRKRSFEIKYIDVTTKRETILELPPLLMSDATLTGT